MSFERQTRSNFNGAFHQSDSLPLFTDSNFHQLLHLSAQIGRDPLLIQASNGNTSLKVGDSLWVKASGKWLANALCEEMFVSLSLAETRECVRQQREVKLLPITFGDRQLRPSIETAMHATLPHRVVVHVHSVNTLAHAVRSDAEEHIGRRLSGLRWRWIPYVASGLPLACRVAELVRSSPDFDVLVLGNHGLVVCGDDCTTIERLLNCVESRLMLLPREAPAFDKEFMLQLANKSSWQLPDNDQLHSLATDRFSFGILAAGILYPSQALLLHGTAPWMHFYSGLYTEASRHPARHAGGRKFLLLKDRGVLLSNDISREQLHALVSLAEVAQRIDVDAPLRYLRGAECGTTSHRPGDCEPN